MLFHQVGVGILEPGGSENRRFFPVLPVPLEKTQTSRGEYTSFFFVFCLLPVPAIHVPPPPPNQQFILVDTPQRPFVMTISTRPSERSGTCIIDQTK